MNKIIYSFTLLFLLFIYQANAQLKSGQYGDVTLAVDNVKKEVTGCIKVVTGDKMQYSCIFMFRGTLNNLKDGKMKIEAFYPLEPDKIEGELTVISDSKFSLKLNRDIGGCYNGYPFRNEPVTFELKDEKAWINIKMIKEDKSFFYETMNGKKMKAFAVKGDFVKVLEKKDDWYKVENTTKEGVTTIGWMNNINFVR